MRPSGWNSVVQSGIFSSSGVMLGCGAALYVLWGSMLDFQAVGGAGGYTSTLGSFAARETATLQISNLDRSVQNEEEDEDDETPFPVYVG